MALTEDQRAIVDLLEEMVEEGDVFFKSRQISHELGMSSRKVGANIRRISESYERLSVERWSESNSTTWRVKK
ncbi:MAG: hypothetical protein SV253_09960 [Halobacteria archaeon]|nr:hypothetical protein [Halobacteria archaeon]